VDHATEYVPVVTVASRRNMASNFELLRSTVSNLSIDDSNRTRLLSDLKLAVGSLSSAEQKLAIRSLELENIFDCLNSSET
jgi:hypothetical protein